MNLRVALLLSMLAHSLLFIVKADTFVNWGQPNPALAQQASVTVAFTAHEKKLPDIFQDPAAIQDHIDSQNLADSQTMIQPPVPEQLSPPETLPVDSATIEKIVPEKLMPEKVVPEKVVPEKVVPAKLVAEAALPLAPLEPAVQKPEPVKNTPMAAAPKKKPAPQKKLSPKSSPDSENISAQSQPAPAPEKITQAENTSNTSELKQNSRTEPLLGQGNAPRYKRFISPEYPQKALLRGLEGQVLLRVHISEQGKASAWEVVESTDPLFIAAAEKSLRLSTFEPMLLNGQATACWVRIPMRFTLR